MGRDRKFDTGDYDMIEDIAAMVEIVKGVPIARNHAGEVPVPDEFIAAAIESVRRQGGVGQKGLWPNRDQKLEETYAVAEVLFHASLAQRVSDEDPSPSIEDTGDDLAPGILASQGQSPTSLPARI